MHTIGLLSGSFLPDEATEQLSTYCRHRANLLDNGADTTRKMQKYLRLLNLRLIWNMIIKKQLYNNKHGDDFLDQKRKRKVQEMRKLIHKFDIKTNELGLQF